jgi:hypothetical protein
MTTQRTRAIVNILTAQLAVRTATDPQTGQVFTQRADAVGEWFTRFQRQRLATGARQLLARRVRAAAENNVMRVIMLAERRGDHATAAMFFEIGDELIDDLVDTLGQGPADIESLWLDVLGWMDDR